VLPVKFDGGSFISVLRNEQLFKKKIRGSKPISFPKATFPNFSNPAIWKKLHFFGSPFSCERDRQSTIKFSMDPEVLYIYRMIPENLIVLDGLLILVPPQSVAFWELLVGFTTAYSIKCLFLGINQ
jgi:hypothetical protein